MPKYRLLIMVGVACGACAQAAHFYVSPSGDENGSGSSSSPWDLQTALNHPEAVQPGDTIWLRGGVYDGVFVSSLAGAEDAPIYVRAYPHERVTIDGADSQGRDILQVYGAHTWYWGFEVTSSHETRVTSEPGSDPSPDEIPRGGGIGIGNNRTSPGVKFINLVIHDTRQGISFWEGAVDAEIYGCLIYHNGWVGPDRGHGHGVYLQNREGTKILKHNIIFGQGSHGIQAYGSDEAYIDNIQLVENTVFNNPDRDILLGGGRIANSPVISGNHVYATGGGSMLGYNAGISDAVFVDNIFVHADPGAAVLYVRSTPLTGFDDLDNNLVIGSIQGITSAQVSENFDNDPGSTAPLVFIQPNQYERGRGQIIVYNWSEASQIRIEMSSFGLEYGERFVVRDAMNYYGPPVASGINLGGPIRLRMNNLDASTPVGDLPEEFHASHTAPSFAVFLVEPRPGAPPRRAVSVRFPRGRSR